MISNCGVPAEPLCSDAHDGSDDRVRLAGRLAAAGVTGVVDVRRFPGSRRNPDVARDALAGWLSEAGIGYRWEDRLGGRRTHALPGPGGRREHALRRAAAVVRTERGLS